MSTKLFLSGIIICAGIVAAVSSARAAAPYFIEGPQAEVLSCTEVKISWKTDQPTTATVQYWRYIADPTTVQVETMSSNHSIIITLPAHSTTITYRYLITPKNEAGETPVVASKSFNLTRCSGDALLGESLNISLAQVAPVSCSDMLVSWQTNKRADSTVEVTNTVTGEVKTIYSDYKEWSHNITFSRPASRQTVRYTFKVSSTDESGNKSSWPASGTRSFTLSACPVDVGFSKFEIINQSCQDLDLGWQTTAPTRGKVKIWRLADPTSVVESSLSGLGSKTVVHLRTPSRSAPEDYGFEIITTTQDNETVYHYPQSGIIRMYACPV